MIPKMAQSSHIFTPLLEALKEQRGKGRNDYPIHALWEALISQLGGASVPVSCIEKPPASTCTRFLNALLKQEPLLQTLLYDAIQRYQNLHAHFGSTLLLVTFKHRSDRMHFLLDGHSLLPLAQCEIPHPIEAAYHLLEKIAAFSLSKGHPKRYLIADASFDDAALLSHIWDRYRIRPIIPLQSANKEAPKNRPSLYLAKNCYATAQGDIFCPHRLAMVYAGFEEKRQALKYRCIYAHYNSPCPQPHVCPVQQAIRIPLKTDRRLFTPLPRTCNQWARQYERLQMATQFIAYYQNFLQRFCHYGKRKKELLWMIDQCFRFDKSTGVKVVTTCDQSQSQSRPD